MDSLEHSVAQLQAELATLRRRVAELERADAPASESGSALEPAAADADQRSRRGVLKLAAAGLGGAGLAVLGPPGRAAATDGQAVLAGQSNSATATTTVTSDTAGISVLYANATGIQGSVGLRGDSIDYGKGVWGKAGAYGIGVAGEAGQGGVGVAGYNADTGVSAVGNQVGVLCGAQPGGADLVAFGTGLIRMKPYSAAPPTSGVYERGDLLNASDGSGTWICVTSGSPGVWRKLTGPTAAGAFHAITPQRVYNSRTPANKLMSGQTRTVSVANGISSTGTIVTPDLVPAGSTAVALNLTISGTVGAGSLVVWPAGTPKPLATAIQWFAGGQSLSNGFTAAISAARQLAVYCSAGSTHLLIDIAGYYR
jgi:hypothetical protein